MALVKVLLNGQTFSIPLKVKEFSTGSLGYNGADKIIIEAEDESYKFQVAVNITLIGSKDIHNPELRKHTKEVLERL